MKKKKDPLYAWSTNMSMTFLKNSVPWVGVLRSSAYRGPWWAWRASYHAIHPLPLPLVDIEDITFNVIQFELTGMHGSMQLCERLP